MEVLNREELLRLGLDVPAVVGAATLLARGNARQKWHIPNGTGEGDCNYIPAAAQAEQVPLLDALPQLCSLCRVKVDTLTASLWRACAVVVDAEAKTVLVEVAARPKETGSWTEYAVALSRSPAADDARVRLLLEPVLASELAVQGRQVLLVWEGVLKRWASAMQRLRAVLPMPLRAAAVASAVDLVRSGAAWRGAELDRLHGRQGGPAPLWRIASATWASARASGSAPAVALGAALENVQHSWSLYPICEVDRLPVPAVTSADGHDSPAAWARAEADHHAKVLVTRWCGLLDQALAKALTACEEHTQLLLVHDWPLVRVADAPLAFLSAWEQIGPTVPTAWLPAYGRDPDDGGMRHAAVLAVPAAAAAIAQRVTADQFDVRHDPRSGSGRVALGPSLGTGHSPETVAAMAATLLRTAFPLLPEDLAPLDPVSDAVARVRAELASAARPFPDDDPTEPVRRLSVSTWPILKGGLAWIPGTESFEELLASGYGDTIHVSRLVVQSGPGTDGPLVVVDGNLARTHADGTITFTPPRGEPLQLPLNRIAAVLSRPILEPRRSDPEPRLWAPWEGTFHALAGHHMPTR